MFPNSIAAFGAKNDKISRDQYAADFQQQTNNLNTMLQMLRCVAYKSTAQSIPNAADTTLTFDTNLVDIGFLHEVVIHPTRFTALADGFYQAVGQVDLGTSGGGTARAIQVKVNGAFPAFAIPAFIIPPNTLVNRLQVTGMLQLQHTDYVEFVVYQNSGGAVNTAVATTWGSLTLISRL